MHFDYYLTLAGGTKVGECRIRYSPDIRGLHRKGTKVPGLVLAFDDVDPGRDGPDSVGLTLTFKEAQDFIAKLQLSLQEAKLEHAALKGEKNGQ